MFDDVTHPAHCCNNNSENPQSSPPDYSFQPEVVAYAIAAIAAGENPLIVSPTGSGKSHIIADIISALREGRKNVLVITHRREIITQISQKLHALGIKHGVILAGVDPRPMEAVQVASVQTLWIRGIKNNAMIRPAADVIIIDEAHHTPAATYTKIIESYPEARIVGCTATPCRGDGRGLGGAFSKIIEAPQVAALITRGVLVKTIVYTPVTVNLKGVKTVKGDYHEGQLAHRMDTPQLIGDIGENYAKFGQNRKTVVFAVNVAHSMHICEEFIRLGFKAEHLDGDTPVETRNATLARLKSGETQIISNCMILTEGFDCPDIGCIILARPTKKMGLYRQMLGRALRGAPGKTDAIVIDHSGAVRAHGLAEDHVDWFLDPDLKARSSEAHQSRGDGEQSRGLLECSQCSALRVGGQPCPNCGFLPRRPPK